jgi:topoisomerase-4 subunit A
MMVRAFLHKDLMFRVTRDKLYDLTNGNKGSQILYFTCNRNGEAEVITVILRQVGTIKKLKFDIDFASLSIRARLKGKFSF